jgi:hypothetical protein
MHQLCGPQYFSEVGYLSVSGKKPGQTSTDWPASSAGSRKASYALLGHGSYLDRDRFDTKLREYRCQAIDVVGVGGENCTSTQTYGRGHHQCVHGGPDTPHATLTLQQCRHPRDLLGRRQDNQILQRLIRSSVSLVTIESFRKDYRRNNNRNARRS